MFKFLADIIRIFFFLVAPFQQTSDFQEQLLEKKRQLESSDFRETTLSGLEPFGYDAVLAVALSFNQSVDILEKRGRRLEDFTYNDTDIGSVIFDTISSSNFLGVTVSICKSNEVYIIEKSLKNMQKWYLYKLQDQIIY